jgi:hypothetical protein
LVGAMKVLVDLALRAALMRAQERISPSPSDAGEQQRGLRAGPTKPLEYLTMGEIRDALRTTPAALTREASDRGLQTRLFRVGSPFQLLYVWDEAALEGLLAANAHVLRAANWPLDASGFVQFCVESQAYERTALFDLVADAFADHLNRARLFVERDQLPVELAHLGERVETRGNLGVDRMSGNPVVGTIVEVRSPRTGAMDLVIDRGAEWEDNPLLRRVTARNGIGRFQNVRVGSEGPFAETFALVERTASVGKRISLDVRTGAVRTIAASRRQPPQVPELSGATKARAERERLIAA